MRVRSSFFCALAVAVALGALLIAGCGGSANKEAAPAGETGAASQPEPAAGAQAEKPTLGSGYDAIAEMQKGDATITGTITYVGKVPNLPTINMDADPVCAGKHSGPVPIQALVLGDGNTVANMFVQVKDSFAQGDYPPPSKPVVIEQDGCMYNPHVVGVMAGQPLEFWNADGVLHNVHGLPQKNREFNLGMPATLHEKQEVLNTPESLFPVKCDVHPWMNAYVAVMSHPYFDVTGTDGKYSIKVPAGTYTIEAWQEKLGTQDQKVTVGAGETKTVDFQLQGPKS